MLEALVCGFFIGICIGYFIGWKDHEDTVDNRERTKL